MSNILVTGGAGFIGSHLANRLNNENNVVVVDNLSGGFLQNLNSDVKLVRGDITNFEMIDDLFERNNFDYVFHMAAYASEGLSHYVRKLNYNVNVMGSVNLINASVKNKIKKFIFASSIAVYGEQSITPFSEFTKPQPIDPYGVSKYCIELDLQAAQQMFGLNYLVLRPHNVYGPNQNMWDKHRNVVTIFIKQLIENRPLTIYGSGDQMRSFTFVDDIVDIFVNALDENVSNQIFNVGSDSVYSINELADLLMKAIGKNCEKIYLPERHECKNSFADHSKIKSCFSNIKYTDIVEGLQRTIEWALKQEDKDVPFYGIELKDDLPQWIK